MAGASLLALLDDITTILDDVSLLTKVAAKKTAGVLGDDLALNAQQVSGVHADRELAVVWAVAKGSLLNKGILVPLALAISVFAPWAITPLLMVGGAFLCFEGAEKLAHKFLHGPADDEQAHAAKVLTEGVSFEHAHGGQELEREKVKGAIRTDFILSAEIIAISLGTVAQSPFTTQVLVLVTVALAMTVGVYGLVAAIVKLDDLGLHLTRDGAATGWARFKRSTGRGILRAAPYLMRFLSIAGTAAMFLVGGGILVHGVPALHHAVEGATHAAAALPGVGQLFEGLASMLLNGAVGIAAGALVLIGVTLFQKVRGARRAAA